jgi:YrbI family 3-deoxy-D-manno-octulosonate 8-phosphate phosphatase
MSPPRRAARKGLTRSGPRVTSALASLIRGVKLLVLDFDGVLTDNRVLVFDDGTEAVTCWRGDGLGLQALRRLGVELLVLSTETNRVVSVRCEKLRLPRIQGCDDKRSALLEVARERGLQLRQVAYVGNDVNDLECLRLVGVPIVVADAHPDVVSAARWRTSADGGKGAVREVCDLFVSVHSATATQRKARTS